MVDTATPVPCRPDEQRMYEHFRRQFARELLRRIPRGGPWDELVLALAELSREGCWEKDGDTNG